MPQPLFSSKPHDWPWHRRGQAKRNNSNHPSEPTPAYVSMAPITSALSQGPSWGARVNTLDPYNGMSIARRAFSCRDSEPDSAPDPLTDATLQQ